MPAYPISLYPVVIVQDRYGGAYAEGEWIAVAEADGHTPDGDRIGIVMDQALGSDTEAMTFWAAPPDWVAVGNSPDHALAALVSKFKTEA